MRSYRPASWSTQARLMCDKQLYYIAKGTKTIEEGAETIRNSYRHPLIKQRAIKRFGRKVKNNDFNYNLYLEWCKPILNK